MLATSLATRTWRCHALCAGPTLAVALHSPSGGLSSGIGVAGRACARLMNLSKQRSSMAWSAWASAGDAWPDGERASRRLVLLGLAAAVPAALAGTADWSEQHEQQMRVGAVHAMANAAAAGLYLASLVTRAGPRSRALRLAGLAVAGVSGLLGGHI